MNPMVGQAIGSIVRAVFMVLAGWLVSNDIWTSSEAAEYAAAAAVGVPVLLWSLWQKYQGRLKLLVALASPKATTEAKAAAIVATGEAPSVTTPTNEVPALKK